MGIAINGLHGEVTGRVDNLVYYVLNGKNVVRKVGKSYKPASTAQLSARMLTKLSSQFFSKLQDYINVGFGIEALGTDKNAFNLAIQENKKSMLKGVYPDFTIDYPKLVFSRGVLKTSEGLKAIATVEGISFTWDTDPKMPWAESTDQVMMIAYFPTENKAVHKLFGNNRITGEDQLVLSPSLRGKYAETYIGFISADRKQISDSSYTGSINLTETE
ncbi:hypothetical protein ACVWYN_001099 [Pedobacter sp. UYP24]